MTKATYFILGAVMQAINATRSFQIARTWGYKDPKTGEWTGMTGDLVRKDVDIGGI